MILTRPTHDNLFSFPCVHAIYTTFVPYPALIFTFDSFLLPLHSLMTYSSCHTTAASSQSPPPTTTTFCTKSIDVLTRPLRSLLPLLLLLCHYHYFHVPDMSLSSRCGHRSPLHRPHNGSRNFKKTASPLFWWRSEKSQARILLLRFYFFLFFAHAMGGFLQDEAQIFPKASLQLVSPCI